MTVLLQVIGLTKQHGRLRVLDKVTLFVRPGEFVAVLGPSGAGKTTLLRCIARLTEPDAGEIHIAGHAFHQLHSGALVKARRDIGIVFQQFNLIRRRSALENVLAGRLGAMPLWRIATEQFSREDHGLATAALQLVGLGDQAHQRADTLSGGQQQRVAIARALAQQSRVLLADEPVASLDPDTAVSILTLMRDIARERRLAILCTLHQPHLAERFADRMLEMRDGRISTADVALQYSSDQRITIIAQHEAKRLPA